MEKANSLGNSDFLVEFSPAIYSIGSYVEGTVTLNPSDSAETQQVTVSIICDGRAKRKYVNATTRIIESEWTNTRICKNTTKYELKDKTHFGEALSVPFKVKIPQFYSPVFMEIDAELNWSLEVEVKLLDRNMRRSLEVRVQGMPQRKDAGTQEVEEGTDMNYLGLKNLRDQTLNLPPWYAQYKIFTKTEHRREIANTVTIIIAILLIATTVYALATYPYAHP